MAKLTARYQGRNYPQYLDYRTGGSSEIIWQAVDKTLGQPIFESKDFGSVIDFIASNAYNKG